MCATVFTTLTLHFFSLTFTSCRNNNPTTAADTLERCLIYKPLNVVFQWLTLILTWTHSNADLVTR